tara:strand:+ start:318 stop:791 length:474 start_codon:yes stop_codon:yes gene_type:complete
MLSIIGCGNVNRKDDGVGIAVVQQLLTFRSKWPKEKVQLFDSGTAGMDIMFQARGSDALIIIDASNNQSEPGQIFEVPGAELEALPEPSYNLHDFRWDNALYAGRKIFKEEFPAEVTVYLVEAETLEFGIGLSDCVEQSAKRVVELIGERVETYLNA